MFRDDNLGSSSLFTGRNSWWQLNMSFNCVCFVVVLKEIQVKWHTFFIVARWLYLSLADHPWTNNFLSNFFKASLDLLLSSSFFQEIFTKFCELKNGTRHGTRWAQNLTHSDNCGQRTDWEWHSNEMWKWSRHYLT